MRGFEELLGFHAAPMFLGYKPASLLAFSKVRFANLDELMAEYQPCFSCKGIRVRRLSESAGRALILFYREQALQATLRQPKVRLLLRQFGYPVEQDLMAHLDFLQRRVQESATFPHEIGLFLGYPPEDVAGFIANHGQQFRCCGYWKVYANEQQTKQLFAFYANCTKEFCWKLRHGVKLPELVRAVS